MTYPGATESKDLQWEAAGPADVSSNRAEIELADMNSGAIKTMDPIEVQGSPYTMYFIPGHDAIGRAADLTKGTYKHVKQSNR